MRISYFVEFKQNFLVDTEREHIQHPFKVVPRLELFENRIKTSFFKAARCSEYFSNICSVKARCDFHPGTILKEESN